MTVPGPCGRAIFPAVAETLAGDCLGTETLIAVAEGRDDKAARVRVRAHISSCGSCRRTVSALAIERGAEPRDAGSVGFAPGSRIGRYVVGERAGEGGMGVVYIAHDPELERDVAVKVLHETASRTRPALAERLRQEAKALARLSHPNVVAVYDVGLHDEHVFIAMERVIGDPLAVWLEQARPWRDTLTMFLAAGRGLAAVHAAGLTHRDFKPQNVLLGDDGRPRVADFGLARVELGGRAGSSDGAGERPVGITHTGTLLGTPLYMAPEQHRGESADARSDQFAYCVSLWIAVYRQRPFAGSTAAELARAVHRGELCRPPRSSRVPARLARVLRRGMAPDRAQRFPSMDELLRALDRVARPRRRIAAVGGAVAVVAAIALLASRHTAAPPPACDGARARVAEVWNPASRAQVASAMHRLALPFGTRTAAAIDGILDDYAARWASLHGDACRATRVLGWQTEAQLELRTTCLEVRLGELRALVDRLQVADATIAEHATAAARDLADLSACADLVALATPIQPPTPGVREAVAALASRLAALHARETTGDYRAGLTLARDLARAAHGVSYRPLEAAVELSVGRLAQRVDDAAGAERAFEAAIWAAEAGRDDPAAARALIGAIGAADRLGRYEAIPSLVARASAVFERMGPQRDELSLELEATLGEVAQHRGNFAEADRRFSTVVTTLERRLGRAHPRLAEPLRQLANALRHGPALDRALELAQRALVIQRAEYADDHPAVASALEMVAAVERELGRYSDAERDLERVIAIRERVFGPNSAHVAQSLYSLGLVHSELGLSDKAVATMRKVVAIDRTVIDPDTGVVGDHLSGLAGELETLGRYDEAIEMDERALELLRRRFGEDDYRVAETLNGEASIELSRHRPDAALALARRADQINQRVLARSLPDPLRNIGAAYLAVGNPAAAVAPLAHAYELARVDADAARALWVASLLARARFDAGERDAGRRLAIETAARMTPDDRLDSYRHDLEAWMKRRGIPIRSAK